MSTKTKAKPAPEPTAEERLRQQAEIAREALIARDMAIVEMRGEGFSHRAIAEAAGLSHTAVQFILKRDGTG